VVWFSSVPQPNTTGYHSVFKRMLPIPSYLCGRAVRSTYSTLNDDCSFRRSVPSRR